MFRQVRGREFTYTVEGNGIRPSTTDFLIARSQFDRALARVPISRVAEVQDLFGPSYLFAILTDRRIAGSDWPTKG